jgi:D-beta-D-heptose 7-phosphate kinase/D-beta-D-heptose 1-phosphate adenosyltransferase
MISSELPEILGMSDRILVMRLGRIAAVLRAARGDASRAARRIRELVKCESVLITRGEHGMWLLDGDGEASLPAEAREVADVTGAGDTVISALALGLAAGATLTDAARLANRAAGIVVGKFGAATVSARELTQ